MKYLFFVQGEGRGHFTQALTLQEKLESRGHKIVAIVVGANNGGEPPRFFQEQIHAPLFLISSPNFAVDKKGQGIKILPSILLSLKQMPQYLQSYRKIKTIINDCQPDVLVSFYEPLAGIYYRLAPDKRPLFCLGHQYFVEHPSFKFPPRRHLSRWFFKFYNRLTAPGRSTKIALSFLEASDQIAKKIIVCPPLIRRVIREQKPVDDDFILIYILNAGYSEKIIEWSSSHPGVKIEAFWNHPEAEETMINPDLIFHHLSGEMFIQRLAACRAYASTGGFDSISEAAYLQKPILMNPTKNHFEQKCNAVDAARAGLAIATDDFDLSLIASKSTKTQSLISLHQFKDWVDCYDDKIVDCLEK